MFPPFSFFRYCKYLVTLVLFTLFLVPFAGRTQAIRAYPNNPQANDVSHSIVSLPALTPSNPNFTPFYWSFWIYGDGEFGPLPGSQAYWQNYGIVSYPASSPANYTYLTRSAQYQIINYLITRKSDDQPPPDEIAANITVPSGGSGTPTSRIALTGSNSLDLRHNQSFLTAPASNGQKEKSVFILSYKPACQSFETLKVLFFYNGRYNTSSQTFAAGTNLGQLSQGSVYHLPNYDKATPADVLSDTRISQFPTPMTAAAYDASAGTSFANGFGNMHKFVVKSSYTSLLSNQIPELRVFYPLETIDLNGLSSSNKASALAVLTSECPPDSAPNFGMLEQFNVSKQGAYWKIGSDYVVGLDTVLLSSGEPSDPNQIVIDKICKCDPKSNKSIVTFDLEFCNSQNAGGAANTVNIKLRSLFSSLTILNAGLVNANSRETCGLRQSDKGIEIKGMILRAGQCRHVKVFTSIPDADLPALIKSPVLAGSVEFNNSRIITEMINIPLPPKITNSSVDASNSDDARWINRNNTCEKNDPGCNSVCRAYAPKGGAVSGMCNCAGTISTPSIFPPLLRVALFAIGIAAIAFFVIRAFNKRRNTLK